jgi:hypothetical protein
MRQRRQFQAIAIPCKGFNRNDGPKFRLYRPASARGRLSWNHCGLPGFTGWEQGEPMSDDKTDRGAEDRTLVSDEPYEVAYFARKHGISEARALMIIAKHGPGRAACDEAAERLK